MMMMMMMIVVPALPVGLCASLIIILMLLKAVKFSKYDTKGNVWSILVGKNDCDLEISARNLGGLVYIVGGYEMYCFEPETETWSSLASPSFGARGTTFVVSG
jgi:nitrogen fixation-related uncharacterized protein